MTRRHRIVSVVMVAFVAAGSICVAVALYAPAFLQSAEGSLILTCLLPAYLALSYCTPGRRSS